MMSSKEISVKPSDLDNAKSAFNNTGLKYKWVNNFIVISNPAIKNYSEVWDVNIFRQKMYGLPHKSGDLVISLAGGNKGEPVYYR